MKKTFITHSLLLAFAAAGWVVTQPARASTDAWTGNADANWSNPANWTFSSGSTVNPGGDYLVFGVAGSSGAALTDDLTAYSFAGIWFTNGASAYAFGGNAFSLTGGITNSSASAQFIGNNLLLTTNLTVSDIGTGTLTLGGIIDDGGNGYGLTFPGNHNVTLTNANPCGGTDYIYGGGTVSFTYGGGFSNGTVVLGKTGSAASAYLTTGGNTLPAGTTFIASNLMVDASILGGQNFANWNISGTSAGNSTNEFSGALELNTGLLRITPAPNASYNLELLFNSYSRNPGTLFDMNNGTAPGVDSIASQTAGQVNIVFNNPPALLGSGTVGTTTCPLLPGVMVGQGAATYDTTYGLRGLQAAEYVTAVTSGMTPSENVLLGATPATLTANTELNSLHMNFSGTWGLGGNTLTVDSGWVSSQVNGVIGASANDGFLALGAEGTFFVSQARTMTVNSVITGSGGLTIDVCDVSSTAGNCVLAGTNTFTGVTRVLGDNGLTVHINNARALQNSTLDYNNYGGTITLGSGITGFTFGGLTGAQNLAITVPLTLGGDNDASDTYRGVLSGAGSLTKTGTGAFTLTGTNTYSGGTILSSGQLNINYGGNSSANSAIGTAPVTINGGTIDNTSGSAVTLVPNNAQNWNSNFTFNGSASLNLGTGLVALGGNEQVTVNANTLTVGGAISGTGDSLNKAGAGILSLSAANSYTGNTIVGGGKLALTGSAGIGSSPSIIVSNGATLDVSGLSSTFTLGGAQSLHGSGTINGSVSTTSGSEIYADSGVAYGTNTFNNNLTLASGAVANFNLGTVVSGPNDLIAVGGNLALNGNTINISAPSTSASLQAANYVLFEVNGSISGTVAATPNWVVKPANYGNYTIVIAGNLVLLQHQTAINPSVAASANPASQARGQNTTITAVVTVGTYPVSSVSVNATPIGGAAAVSLVQSNSSSVYTNTLTIGTTAPAGSTPLTVTVTDSQGDTGTGLAALTVLPGTEAWSGGSTTDNNWSDGANWAGGAAPLSGDAVTFAGSTRLNPVMDYTVSLSSVTFASGAGSFVITNASGSVLTLGGGSGVANNAANPQALNMPIVLGTAQTINAAAGSITLGGTVSGGASLTETGTNLLTLAGANTYGGGTTVNAGTVVVANNSALGSGVLTLAGGSISNSAGVSYSVPNNVTVASAANVGVGLGDTLTLAGTVSGGAPLTEVGNGTLVLPSANSISGGVTVSSGTLVVANNAAVGSGLLTLGTCSISNAAGSSYTVRNNVNLAGGTANVVVGTHDTFSLDGVITNGGGLNLTGGGTLTIAGTAANTYSGGTEINAGFLDVENSSASPLGAGTLTLAGGSLENEGSLGVTIGNNIYTVTNTTTTVPTGGLTLAGNISGPGNLVIAGSATQDFLSGTNSGFTGTLTVNNASSQRFTFANPAAGSPNAAWVLNSAGTDEQKFTFGTGTISFGSLAGGDWLRNDGGASLVTLSIGGLNTNAVFGGLIVGNGSAGFGMLKVGTGVETFTGNNTYAGTNEVAAGMFELTSAQQTQQPLQVDDGATFGYQDTGSGLSAQVASMTLGTNAGANLFFTNIYAAGAVPVNIGNGELTANGNCVVTLADTTNLTAGNIYLLISYSAFSGNGNFVLSPLPGGTVGGVINDPAYGGLFLSLPQSTATSATNLTATVDNSEGVSTLNLSWPANYQGWVLETNNVGLNVNSAWGVVSGSEYTTSESFTIDPTQTNVFFQLVLP